MATSLWPLALAFAFGDLLVPWPLEICLCRGQGPGHGAGRGHARRTGNGLKPKAMAMGKTVMASSPRQSHQALSHGNRFRPWLGPQAYGQRNVSMGIGCRVWGVGYWVVDIGYRVLVFGCFGFRYRVAASLSNSNMLDARWVGRFWYFDIFGNLVLGFR